MATTDTSLGSQVPNQETNSAVDVRQQALEMGAKAPIRWAYVEHKARCQLNKAVPKWNCECQREMWFRGIIVGP